MNFTISLTDREIQIVATALGKMPFEVVAAVIGKMQAQISEQQRPKEDITAGETPHQQ